MVLATAAAFAWQGGDGRVGDAAPDGLATFQTHGCSGCHLISDASSNQSIGPVLTDLAQRADTRVEGLSASEYVTQSIRSPSAFIVPGFPNMMPKLELTDAEVAALVELLLEPAGP